MKTRRVTLLFSDEQYGRMAKVVGRIMLDTGRDYSINEYIQDVLRNALEEEEEVW